MEKAGFPVVVYSNLHFCKNADVRLGTGAGSEGLTVGDSQARSGE